MRSALLFTTILLFAIVPFSNPVTADGLDEDTGITISASYDSFTEMTTLNVTMPVTDNATLLDELKEATFSIDRFRSAEAPTQLVESVAENLKLCTQSMSNFNCSGAVFTIEYHPKPDNSTQFEYMISTLHAQANPTNHTFSIFSNSVEENISESAELENLTASYSDDITILSWDYPESVAMNHSIMIYSHDSPATRENWNFITKTIVSSSITAGTPSYQINHSGDIVEREIYYSVTLLFGTSEDTRFLGSNTLTEPVKEDNKAPIFLGELQATFNPDTDTTTIDWGEGLSDSDLSINIYRSETELLALDPTMLMATAESSTTSFNLQIPFGEYQQSWYAISLEDQEGNEVMSLSDSSPVAGPIIESTISAPTITNLGIDRNADGSITLSWEDRTDEPNTVARVWRSTTGVIESLQNTEELVIINASNQQFTHNPLNPVDEAWYAITFVGRWGSSIIPWHVDTLTLGVNSMNTPVRETEVIAEEPTIEALAHYQSTNGAGGGISDGSLIYLGAMYEGDIIIISTSVAVDNISCNDINGQGSVIFSQSDWTLSFGANQSGEICLGTITQGENQIGFTLTWNYADTLDNNVGEQNSYDEGFEDGKGFAQDKANESANEQVVDAQDPGESVNATNVILGIAILVLLVYLLVMMRSPDYKEEE